MNFNVIATKPFERKLKKLSKKYLSLPEDVQQLISLLETNPNYGIYLGNNCYKIRLAITSKGKGKSAGARVITFVRLVHNKVFLLTMYDKSQRSTITDNNIKFLLKRIQKVS